MRATLPLADLVALGVVMSPSVPDHARPAVGAVARQAAATTLDPSWTTPHRVPRRSSPSSSPTTPGPGSRRSWTASRRRTTPTCACSSSTPAPSATWPNASPTASRGPSCARSATRAASAPRPTRLCGSWRARGSSACSTTTWRWIPMPSGSWWRRPTARTPASSGRSSSTGRPPSTSLEVGDAADKFGTPGAARRSGRARPGAARRRARRVLRALGVPARAHRPVPRPGRLRRGHPLRGRRPRPVLARPRRRGAGAGRAGRQGAPPPGPDRAGDGDRPAPPGGAQPAPQRARQLLRRPPLAGGAAARPAHGGLRPGRSGHGPRPRRRGRAGRLAVEPGAGRRAAGQATRHQGHPPRARPRGARAAGAGERPTGSAVPRAGRRRQPLQRGRCGPAQPRRRHPRSAQLDRGVGGLPGPVPHRQPVV